MATVTISSKFQIVIPKQVRAMHEALAAVADNREGRDRHSGAGNTACLAHDGQDSLSMATTLRQSNPNQPA